MNSKYVVRAQPRTQMRLNEIIPMYLAMLITKSVINVDIVVQWIFLNTFYALENYNIWKKSTIYLLFRSMTIFLVKIDIFDI